MTVTAWLAEAAVGVVRALGYWGIVVLMALESAMVPIPSEVVMPFAGVLVARGEMNFTAAVAAGTLGNVVGSLALYLVGARWGRAATVALASRIPGGIEHLRQAEAIFERHGHLVVFVGRLMPAVRTVISLPAGVARMPLYPFLLYTLVGSIPWNAALVYVGVVLGENWGLILEYSPYLDAVTLVVTVLLAAYVLRRLRRRASPLPAS